MDPSSRIARCVTNFKPSQTAIFKHNTEITVPQRPTQSIQLSILGMWRKEILIMDVQTDISAAADWCHHVIMETSLWVSSTPFESMLWIKTAPRTSAQYDTSRVYLIQCPIRFVYHVRLVKLQISTNLLFSSTALTDDTMLMIGLSHHSENLLCDLAALQFPVQEEVTFTR